MFLFIFSKQKNAVSWPVISMWSIAYNPENFSYRIAAVFSKLVDGVYDTKIPLSLFALQ